MAAHIEQKPRVIIPRAGRGNEILAILFIALGLLLALCLISATFYPNDPSWNSAGSAETHNWAGFIGANVAATGFQLIGLAAFLLPLLLFAAAWRRFHTAAIHSAWTRIVGLVARNEFLVCSTLRNPRAGDWFAIRICREAAGTLPCVAGEAC